MTKLSPEENIHSRGDNLVKNTSEPTLSETSLFGENSQGDSEAIVKPFTLYDPDFIGPRNATDEARPLLQNQARSLAQISVMNLPAYGRQYLRTLDLAKTSVAEGTLSLNAEFKHMSPDHQAEAFVCAAISKVYKAHDEVARELKVEQETLRIQLGGPESKLQIELNATREVVKAQAARILSVRGSLVGRGASVDYMREFDYTTKLMSKPEQEAYEQEMQLLPEAQTVPLVDTAELNLFEKFKKVLLPSFGRKALRSVGILSPKSAEIPIVQ